MAEQTEAIVEVAKNCAGCKKILSQAKKYYRNGAYYCNKNCFNKKSAEDAAKVKEEAEAAAPKEVEVVEKPAEVKEEAAPVEVRVAEKPTEEAKTEEKPVEEEKVEEKSKEAQAKEALKEAPAPAESSEEK